MVKQTFYPGVVKSSSRRKSISKFRRHRKTKKKPSNLLLNVTGRKRPSLFGNEEHNSKYGRSLPSNLLLNVTGRRRASLFGNEEHIPKYGRSLPSNLLLNVTGRRRASLFGNEEHIPKYGRSSPLSSNLTKRSHSSASNHSNKKSKKGNLLSSIREESNGDMSSAKGGPIP
jgi:hypothetical protein